MIATLGYPVFDGLEAKKLSDVLHLKNKKVDAKGEWTEEGLVVFEGSIASLTETKSAAGTWVSNIRRNLMEEGVLNAEHGVLRFTRSHVFGTPSAAAVAVLGSNANGWTSWKFSDGRALNEVRIKSANEAELHSPPKV